LKVILIQIVVVIIVVVAVVVVVVIIVIIIKDFIVVVIEIVVCIVVVVVIAFGMMKIVWEGVCIVRSNGLWIREKSSETDTEKIYAPSKSFVMRVWMRD
jgi:glucan phosphoethanolaminetransferase (alkaline phosphatase superfamily)